MTFVLSIVAGFYYHLKRSTHNVLDKVVKKKQVTTEARKVSGAKGKVNKKVE